MTASVEAVGGLRLGFLANGILPNDAVRQAFVQHSTGFGMFSIALMCRSSLAESSARFDPSFRFR
ncbi:hypothetical protein [Burkholderia mayonis]|uniref:Uncharacterized protein n=1 Tax=Burkholderia mayonis TaxID=1385591 RepID=A0A1B4FQK3_9BURK|nr:hypothetical protein [Burkholderia mayonis]AOJ05924.1 hypothetical protein WS71_00225 [Burkholderia mayonis]KVE51112.1 hypothetical protein WS71_13360 [Burkholderia mayonis]